MFAGQDLATVRRVRAELTAAGLVTPEGYLPRSPRQRADAHSGCTFTAPT